MPDVYLDGRGYESHSIQTVLHRHLHTLTRQCTDFVVLLLFWASKRSSVQQVTGTEYVVS